MSTTTLTTGVFRRLGAAVAAAVLVAGVLVVLLAVDVPKALATNLAPCSTTGDATTGAGGSSYSVGQNCGPSQSGPNPSSGRGRGGTVNLDPNRQVCFYRASSGEAPYRVAEPPAGETAADGRSMDKYCGKASQIAAMQASSDPLSACSGSCGATYGVWVPNGTAPTPAEIATSLLAKLDLGAPTKIYTSPDADKNLVVGLPTWLWIERGQDEVSGSDQGVTVTARRTVRWTVDGTTLSCTGPGTPYVHGTSDPKGESPDCGYTFTRPGAHTITVTANWTVTVTGAAVTLPPSNFTVTRPVQVDEVQTVNR